MIDKLPLIEEKRRIDIDSFTKLATKIKQSFEEESQIYQQQILSQLSYEDDDRNSFGPQQIYSR